MSPSSSAPQYFPVDIPRDVLVGIIEEYCHSVEPFSTEFSAYFGVTSDRSTNCVSRLRLPSEQGRAIQSSRHRATIASAINGHASRQRVWRDYALRPGAGLTKPSHPFRRSDGLPGIHPTEHRDRHHYLPADGLAAAQISALISFTACTDILAGMNRFRRNSASGKDFTADRAWSVRRRNPVTSVFTTYPP